MATGQAIERAREILEVAPNRLARAAALGALGLLRAMQGAYDEGRRLVEEVDAILRELGIIRAAAAHSIARAEVEIMAGQLEAAERILRAGYEQMESYGDDHSRVNAAWRLALVLAEPRRRRGGAALGADPGDRPAGWFLGPGLVAASAGGRARSA